MTANPIHEPRVLAIAPCVQGIGFVLFDGPGLPVDWGVKWSRQQKNAKGVADVEALITRFQPDVLVFEDARGDGSRRVERIELLLDAIAARAQAQNIATACYSRGRIRRQFATAGAQTKYEIAKIIARQLPELAVRLPGPRKIWLPEHANMSLFDAAALAIIHYAATQAQAGAGKSRAAQAA